MTTHLEPLESRRLLAAISGTVYQDHDASGDFNAGDKPLADWTIFIDSNRNGQLDAGEPSTKSGIQGRYSFMDLAPGATYFVRELVKVGYNPGPQGLDPYNVPVTQDIAYGGKNFGNRSLLGPTFPNYFPLTNNQENASAGPPQSAGAIGTGKMVSIDGPTMVFQAREGKIFTASNSRGTPHKTEPLTTFFSPLLPGPNLTNPRVIFDLYSQRFIVAALDNSGTSPRILLAASRQVNPLQNWNFYSIDSSTAELGVTALSHLAIANDQNNAIYLTADIADSSGVGSRVWIEKKGPLYNNKPMVMTVFDPAAEAGLSSPMLAMQPASISGNTFQDAVGTYLLSQAAPNGPNDYRLQIVRIDSPLKNPVFSAQLIDAGAINAGFDPNVPQPDGGPAIDVGDSTPTNAVWRAKALFTAATVAPPTGPDAGQPTAHWFRIDTSNINNLTLKEQGDICGEDIAAQTATFHPVIAVNRDLFISVGFSAVGPNTFLGSYVTGRMLGDPAGTMRSSLAVAAGQDIYPSGTWQDYSVIQVDPNNSDKWWVFGAFALPRDSHTQAGLWGQQWIQIALPMRRFPVHE